MKAKVLKEFTDKYTKIRHEVGGVFEGTDQRVKELSERGLVEAEKTKKNAKYSK